MRARIQVENALTNLIAFNLFAVLNFIKLDLLTALVYSKVALKATNYVFLYILTSYFK